jgi:hypothetical protein
MRRLFVGFLAAALVGCQQGETLSSSGVADVDQTAAFLSHVVHDLRAEQRFDRASDLAGYMTSAVGKAEILPPSPEFESQAAAYYKGPRPSDKVGVWSDFWDTSAFDYYILVSGDDKRGVVVLDAYRMGDTCAFYRWEL